jgi:hypothetical protein
MFSMDVGWEMSVCMQSVTGSKLLRSIGRIPVDINAGQSIKEVQ